MKKLISLILYSFCLIANISPANASADTITQAEQKISEARLLEQYIIRYVIRIRNIEYQFPNIDASYIEENLHNIEKILKELDNIQKWNYTLKQSEDILENIIVYMRILNTDLQSRIDTIVAAEKIELEKWIRRYKWTVESIYNLTRKVIEINSRYYLNLTTLSKRDKDAIETIVQLRQKNELLIQYDNQKYQNIQELQWYLRQIIISIRQDIMRLRELRRS